MEGLVGGNESPVYKDIKVFMTQVHEHKESIFDDIVKLYDLKLREL